MTGALLLSLLLFTGKPAPQAARRVLVLYSTNRLVPATARWDNRFRGDLGTHVADADFFTEFLDLSRVTSAEQQEQLAQALHARYRDRPPAVIVAGGLQSSLFVSRHRAALFPGVPLVFGGVPSSSLPTLPADSLTTSVKLDFPIRQTAELAARILPNVRELVLLSGNGAVDQRFVADAHAQLKGWTGPTLTFVGNRSFDDMAAYVGKLTPRSAVLLLSFDHDPGGRPWAASAVVAERMSRAASVPVVGISETYVGRGIVGGTMWSIDDLSPSVADVVIQILDGATPSAVNARSIPVRSVVDARQVERWHIDARLLPGGTVVRFAPVSSFRRIWPTFAVSLALLVAATLVALLYVGQQQGGHDDAQSSMNVMAGVLVHELGQPITTQHLDATVALKLLESGQLDPEQAHVILTSIATAAGRASDIATAIRQLLQTRALRREPVALDALVARMVSRVFADSDTGGGTRLEVAVAHETVLGDAVLLQQVIFNLLLNAREAIERASDRRGVVAIRSERDGPSAVRLEVIDNGPGIALDIEDRVFEPFFSSKQGGLGIGLSLCRLIVESHGGTLTVERGIEDGARFVARLPIAPSESGSSAGRPQLIGFARASRASSGASSRGPS